jgi:hypothetical protein
MYPMGPFSHIGATCTTQGHMYTMLEPCVAYGSHLGARWGHVGGKWHHMGAAWVPDGGHMGVVCALWEPRGPYGSRGEPYGRFTLPYRSSLHPMGLLEP